MTRNIIYTALLAPVVAVAVLDIYWTVIVRPTIRERYGI